MFNVEEMGTKQGRSASTSHLRSGGVCGKCVDRWTSVGRQRCTEVRQCEQETHGKRQVAKDKKHLTTWKT